MLSRRSFVALPAAAPIIGGWQPRLDIRDVQHEPLDVGATTILSISPDGAVLAGVQFRNRICFMDAATLEILALGEASVELQLIDRASVHWSPDGTRIAFSLEAWRQMRDSDVFVADVATATITNLTAEGHEQEAASILDVADVAIDIYPRWIDDSTLLFARHRVIEGGESTCEISTIAVESQGAEPLVPLHALGYRFVTSPPLLRANSSMVMTLQGGQQPSEIVIVDADGKLTPVEIAGVRALELLAATDTQALVWDVAGFAYWLVLLDGSGEAMLLTDLFQYGDGYQFIGHPSIAETPVAYAGVALSAASEKYRVFTMIAGERRDRGHLGGEVIDPVCLFAGNKLLISDYRNAWLIETET